MSSLIVTVDGPGGTGKSTVSKVVAQQSGLPHLDTGAFYRAATLAVLRADVAPGDAEQVYRLIAPLDFDQEDGRMLLDGEDVSSLLRSDEVTAAVSEVSAHAPVRARLVELQRAWARRRDNRAVVEGRDIGSVVFPDAVLKIYLDASPAVRAERRAMETGEDVADVLADLNRRDRFDSTRANSPLVVPEDAVVIDTSDMTLGEVVDRILGLISPKY